MANYESHHLYAQGLLENLMNAGVIEPLPEKYHHRTNCRHRIMYAKCDAADWEEQRKGILADGVTDCSKRDENGKPVRRDFTPEEQEELGWYPVHFSSPNEMVWISRWAMDDNPGYYASRALPTQNMIMHLYYEATFDGGWYMKNGKKFADMPSIPDTCNPKQALEFAIDALKAAKLDGYVDEMVNRFMHIDKAEDGRSIEQQQFCVVLDYVYFIEEGHSIADAYTVEEKQEPNSSAAEPNSDLPF
jgi:hypothetical protein